VRRALGGETVKFEKQYIDRDEARHLAITHIPLWLESGRIDGFVAVAQDITEHRQEEGRLLQLTQLDALTGLLNRAGFEQYVSDKLRRSEVARSLALLYIDLDHFKPVNDNHGHLVGDELLKQFAQRLKRTVRPTDAVARLGGDEFAIVMVEVRDSASAQAVATKVISAARVPFRVGAVTLHIGASVGVAFGVDPSGAWQDLVARADANLYRAKSMGRGRVASPR
jgi:diguanylate cyclase (GGDEF)-like protein